MGGYGALRYSLAHPDLFGAAIVLSPAVYVPLPPSDSSTREFGAFGLGKSLFVDSIYRKLNYPAVFPSFAATGLELPMFIAVGDDEYKNPNPKDASHDLDFEAHVLFNQAVRVPNLIAELRVVDGGHDWDVWGPTFVEGAKYVFQFNQAPVAPMKASLTGTAQEERAGGVAVDASGNVYQALAAGGSVDGQPYAGDKDLVLVKDSPAGTRLWTRELGTTRLERAYGVALDAAGNVVVTGYTNGDLDGNHAANTTDDVFVVKFDPTGPASGSGSSASRPSPTAATRSPPTRARTSTSPATPEATSGPSTRATRTSTSPSSTRTACSCCSSSGAPARTRRGASPRQPTESASAA